MTRLIYINFNDLSRILNLRIENTFTLIKNLPIVLLIIILIIIFNFSLNKHRWEGVMVRIRRVKPVRSVRLKPVFLKKKIFEPGA